MAFPPLQAINPRDMTTPVRGISSMAAAPTQAPHLFSTNGPGCMGTNIVNPFATQNVLQSLMMTALNTMNIAYIADMFSWQVRQQD